MQEEKIKATVYSVFKDGKLLPESEREDITEQCIFFPEGLAVGKVSVSRSLPIKLYRWGGNASASVHISVPYPVADGQLEEATKYASDFCDTEILKQMKQYTDHLTATGVDWQKVEENVGE